MSIPNLVILSNEKIPMLLLKLADNLVLLDQLTYLDVNLKVAQLLKLLKTTSVCGQVSLDLYFSNFATDLGVYRKEFI